MKNSISYKQQLIDLLGDYKDATILDYGCGQGDFIELLLKSDEKPRKIFAVDALKSMLSNVQKRFSNNINNRIILTKLVQNPAEL